MASERSRSAKPLAAIVLAAGDGTRMLSQIPKVIHSLYGKPLIGHVLDAIRGTGIRRIIAVVGYRSDLVRSHLGNAVETVVQRPLKGTAHAVAQALPRLKGFRGDIVVLYGDTPLLTSQTVIGLIDTHRREGAACTLLTAHLQEPTGYGRIVRDQTGRIVRIVEEEDLTQAERAIEEINVGAYCFDARALGQSLKEVRPAHNGEYYLTDTVAHLVKAEAPLASARTRSVGEFLGINTRADLARVQTIMRSRVLEQFMSRGVTIIDPYTTYIDGSASIGQDTVIYPHTVIEGGVRVGRRCQIGPFCRLGKKTVLGNGAQVANFVDLTDCRVEKGVEIHGPVRVNSGQVIRAGGEKREKG
ncbi:MAG: bifunctional N-acetylglucosamine-1-phosphate uridyltransferase/glucosamine-1-phosphate acetyltransferase [Candidatus Omnitrophica bacterium]|nr:bifunctional N-acetylglucosamine-1-phosphate uridyltransferase/glucosamine-1-phosphate acetyltransferase [Candidatus Omnitrophota bacterium]